MIAEHLILFLHQTLISSAIGTILGCAAAYLFCRKSGSNFVVYHVGKIVMWLPIIAGWAIPSDVLSGSTSFTTRYLVYSLQIFTVLLCAFNNFSITRFAVKISKRVAFLYTVRSAFLQGLLVNLISQVWIFPYGWNWFSEPTLSFSPVTLTNALVTIILCVFLITFGSFGTFEVELATFTRIGEFERQISASSHFHKLLYTTSCVFVFNLVLIVGFYSIFRSPLSFIREVVNLIGGIVNIPDIPQSLWKHVATSLLEISGGVLIAISFGAIISRLQVPWRLLRQFLSTVFMMTRITTLALPVLLIATVGYVNFWSTLLCAAVLSMFPCIRSFLTAKKNHNLTCTIIIAAWEGLPYAFIATLFGEAMSGVSGLGFCMIVAKAVGRINIGLALGVLTSIFFALTTLTLVVVKTIVCRQCSNVAET